MSRFLSLPQKNDSRIVLAASLLSILIIGFWASLLSPQNAFDDAYITYRYADNLRHGLGLVYNPGEWVLGTTTPLFAILLGGLGLLFTDLEWLGHSVGVLSWIAAALAAMALFWQAKRLYSAVIAGLLLAIQPNIMLSLGMETPLVVALMLTSAWAWLGKRKVLAVILMVFLLLARHDSALWLLFLGLEVWRDERRLPWREGIGTILLTVPWFLYAQSRYGSILPNSALAKIGQTESMGVNGQSRFLLDYGELMIENASYVGIGILLVAVVIGLGVILTKERRFWWLVGWTLTYLCIYQALQVVSFPWYFVPPLVSLQLLLALGIGKLISHLEIYRLARASGKRVPTLHLLVGGIGLLFLMSHLLIQWQAMQHTQKGRAGYLAAYREVGAWLNEHTDKQSRVATIEIGVIGFLSQRPILDTMGLVSPEMTAHLVGWTESLIYATMGQQPDYLVAVQNTGWDWLIKQWWFKKSYQPAASFGSTHIYQRKSAVTEPYQIDLESRYKTGISIEKIEFDSPFLKPNTNVDVLVQLIIQTEQTNNYQWTAFLIDVETYERIALTTFFPFDAGYPSRFWRKGDQLRLPIRLSLPPTIKPGTYRFGLILYDSEQKQEVPLLDPPDSSALEVGWLRLGEPTSIGFDESLNIHAYEHRWEEGMTLSQLAISSDPLTAGETVPIYLSWQVIAKPERNLTFFIHVLNKDGQLIAQKDQLPFQGRFPTIVWQPNETLVERYEVSFPPDLPTGSYDLRLGFYDQLGRVLLDDGHTDSLFLPDMIHVGP